MTLESISNSVVLVRVDFNLPNLEETFRIQALLPTLNFLRKQGNKIVILTHWGRPDELNKNSLSTKNMIPILEKMLQEKVDFINQYEGFELAEEIIIDSHGGVFLLENTRFDKREQSKISSVRNELAAQYASLGQFFVDEAFAVSHRSEATNDEIKNFLPHTYGLRHNQEREVLGNLKRDPKHPFSIILGGAKAETKLQMIQKLASQADHILLGGLLAFTFLKAASELGLKNIPNVFDSVIETDFLPEAKKLLQAYPHLFVLPTDIVFENVDGKMFGRDVGEKTEENFQRILATSKTILWNGPLGWVEKPPYNKSTNQLISFLSKLTNSYVVVGGGDTAAIIPNTLVSSFAFISTGGGATLEFLGA